MYRRKIYEGRLARDNYSSTFTERLAALVVRERATRFAGGSFGYLWAYVTPIFWIGLVVVFFQLLGRHPPIAVGPEIFVATGILPYAMFRQTVTSMMRSLIAHRYMRYVRPITDSDLLMASAASEILNIGLTSLLIFAGLFLIFGSTPPADLFGIYFSMILTWLLGAALGGLFSVIGKVSDSFYRSVGIILRPLFWISGVFYTGTELPESILNILWWNPLFHCIEILREAYFLGYKSPVADSLYPVYFSLVCLLLATVLERRVTLSKSGRHRI